MPPEKPQRSQGNPFSRVEACLARFDIDAAKQALEQCSASPHADARLEVFVRASMSMQEGFGEQACDLLKGLIAANPARRDFWSTYLTALKGTEVSAEAFVGAHRLFAAQFFDDEVEASAPPARVGRAARRLPGRRRTLSDSAFSRPFAMQPP
jgi:hypothetical protein